MNDTQSRIILKCVQENRKLRIKFHSFIDDEGKEHYNVYNNSYNCKFPRDIREVGLYYEIGKNDVELVDNGRVAPFYNIRTTNIRVVPYVESASELKVFEISECVICLGNASSIIFIPCAHRCTCAECYFRLKATSRTPSCPLCRRTIQNISS
jgi:hypothetical protein